MLGVKGQLKWEGTEVEHEVEHEVVGLDGKCNPHLRTTTFTFLLQMVRP